MITARNNSILDKVVDTDEPIIVFRAQDRYSVEVLEHYLYTISVDDTIPDEDGASDEFRAAVSELIDNFREWQEANIEKVKVPDL